VRTITAVGSLVALQEALRRADPIALRDNADVVVVPTAAAFTGAEAAAIEVADVVEPYGVKVEALMNVARASSNEPYFGDRLRAADVVILSDGSSLHARSVWRESLVGEAIRDAHNVIALGAVASVLGDVMIDPRGGAPTNGLGFVSGLVLGVTESDEQLARTRTLLGDDAILAVLGQHGVVHFDGTKWRAVTSDVVTSRGGEFVEL
jgi:hypothetical protein